VIDFRYHIVSLISVFLALAVGIALGAGPLKETIGDTLTGQVAQLRTEKDALRGELDTANGSLKDAQAFLSAASPQLVGGTLPGRRVALVLLGQTDQTITDAITAQLKAAGASVSAQVQVTDTWTSSGESTFRQKLAGTLTTYLDPAPADNATVETQLAEALAQSLTGANPAAPNTLSESAGIVLQLLVKGKLITTTADVTAPADAIVVLAGPISTTSDPLATPDPTEVTTAEMDIARAAQARSEGAVIVGGSVKQGLVTDILADSTVSSRLTTVSDGHEVVGQISVPLALNARIGGVNGHYGTGADLTPIPTTVKLEPVDRTPVPTGNTGATTPSTTGATAPSSPGAAG
jgi:copper transport outer membrane protein MctB